MAGLSIRQAEACSKRPFDTRQYLEGLFLFALQMYCSNASFLTPASPLSGHHLHRAASSADSMDEKTTAAAVRRFTVGYDKLCKNCPIRLQPRVDTLTEMIMGLSPEDRRKLLAAVAQRETSSEAAGLGTPQEVYNFQLSAAAEDNDEVVVVAVEQARQEKTKIQSMKRSGNSIPDGERQLNKIRSKMEKAQGKFMDNEAKLAHAEWLLHVSTLLLEHGNNAEIGIPEHQRDDEHELDKEIASLRNKSHQELKLERLMYAKRKVKCERNRAKYGVKRFAASLELSQVKAQQAL
jgi:hypothetical protein